MYGGMTRNEVRAMLTLLIVITAGIGLRAYRNHTQFTSFIELEKNRNPRNASYHPESHSPPLAYTSPKPPGKPASPASPDMYDADGRLDLNLANAIALDALPRIGEARAKAILKYRNANGPFDDVSQLTLIDGIGEKTLDLLKPLVFVETKHNQSPSKETPLSSSGAEPLKHTASTTPTPTPEPSTNIKPTPDTHDQKININTATKENLQELWNIGPAKAEAIVEYRRRHGLFNSADDLMKVSGIGPATIERNFHRITFSE